ncbi:type III-B CRISPR module RAMP protein Cmr4 [Maridesulfovibrio sp.]|uniref:type III-B CRISPR module RAMP protein Cmr4 n=1 Tax=Maridesulfovibrio sp. TaxID=2795000 RepID=UPI0029F4BE80|nr:type III-B CRISPR module RAMP protein Cmr4 [Maridesulfovibrio sp.]
MFTESNILMYRCMTPLHCGATEAGDGIDLPVVRERYTNFPIIPASSLKGVWRDICQRNNGWDKSKDNNEVTAAFGPDSDEADKKNAGLLGFVDAQILYLPVRASVRTFLLLTCPLQINRFNEARAKNDLPTYDVVEHNDNGKIISESLSDIEELYLEDIKLTADSTALDLPTDGVPAHLKSRLALVSDDTFEWFASNAMEIRAHNKLTESKKSDNLWYAEYVPAESIFFGQLLESPPFNAPAGTAAGTYSSKLMATKPHFFQIGGNESTGHGLINIIPVNQD